MDSEGCWSQNINVGMTDGGGLMLTSKQKDIVIPTSCKDGVTPPPKKEYTQSGHGHEAAFSPKVSFQYTAKSVEYIPSNAKVANAQWSFPSLQMWHNVRDANYSYFNVCGVECPVIDGGVTVYIKYRCGIIMQMDIHHIQYNSGLTNEALSDELFGWANALSQSVGDMCFVSGGGGGGGLGYNVLHPVIK